MDLSKLWKRCSGCRYRSVDDFKRDLNLIASNCRLYCEDKFPSLPPAADAAVQVCSRCLGLEGCAVFRTTIAFLSTDPGPPP